MTRNPRRGFTLIELLIVVVIIGILTAIAIPKVTSVKEKAYVASMKSDLRLMVSAQEAYFADNNGSYATTLAAIGTGYRPSSGNTVQIHNATASGYLLIALNSSTTKTCSLSMGGGSTNEGTPLCQ